MLCKLERSSIHSSVHRTLQMTPGAPVFQRDMFLDVPLIANLQTIRDRCQVLIDENLRQQNIKRAASIAWLAKASWSMFPILESLISERGDPLSFIKFMPMVL
jgi:hypothetical protein